MKRTIRFVLSVITVLLLAGSAQAQRYDYCIRNVTVIRPELASPSTTHQDVFLHGRTIVKIIPTTSSEPKHCMHVIDASGKYLMAGLSDMHVHLPSEKLDQFLLLNLAAGVTTIRAMRGKPWQLGVRNDLRHDSLLGPDLIVSTPYFPNKNIKKAQLRDSIAAYKRSGYDLVKVLAVPDSSYFEELMKAAKSVGLSVAGHWPWQVPIERVIDAGYDCIEHLQGLEDEYSKDSTCIDQLARLLVKHGTWNCPSIDFYAVGWQQVPIDELNRRPGLDLLDHFHVEQWDTLMRGRYSRLYAGSGDSVEKKRMANHEYIAMKLRLLKALADRGARLLVSGADADDPFGVPGFCVWEEMGWYAKAGISNQEILKIATYNPAVYMKQTNQWGSVAVGRRANLILLNKDPLRSLENIKDQDGLFIHGVYFPQEVLRDLALTAR